MHLQEFQLIHLNGETYIADHLDSLPKIPYPALQIGSNGKWGFTQILSENELNPNKHFYVVATTDKTLGYPLLPKPEPVKNRLYTRREMQAIIINTVKALFVRAQEFQLAGYARDFEKELVMNENEPYSHYEKVTIEMGLKIFQDNEKVSSLYVAEIDDKDFVKVHHWTPKTPEL